MNKILFILCLTSASLWMLSCTDYEVASYPEENETEVLMERFWIICPQGMKG